jgi:Tat protein secretion system quality control protein TatD with DNase activity
VVRVAQVVAQLREEPLEVVAEATAANARALYGL